jgi:hypothetical protein
MIINDLKTIVKYLRNSKIKRLEVFSHEDFKGKKSKMGHLFELLESDSVNDLEELKK